jgi:hypothetical protein
MSERRDTDANEILSKSTDIDESSKPILDLVMFAKMLRRLGPERVVINLTDQELSRLAALYWQDVHGGS